MCGDGGDGGGGGAAPGTEGNSGMSPGESPMGASDSDMGTGRGGPSQGDVDLANTMISMIPVVGPINAAMSLRGQGLANFAQGGNVSDYGGGDPDRGGGPDFGGQNYGASPNQQQQPQQAPPFQINPQQAQNDTNMYNTWGQYQQPQMNPMMSTQAPTPPMNWGSFFSLFGGK